MTTSYSTTKYCGHKGPVLCLDVSPTSFSSSSSLLLSGSEDRTARIWDVRTCCGYGGSGGGGGSSAGDAGSSNRRRPRASLCIPTKGDVLSAVFATTRHSRSKTSSQPSSSYDHTIYLGVNNTVLEYDLRQHTVPVDWTAATTTTNADNTNPDSTITASIVRRALKSPIWMDPPTNNLYQVLQNEEEVNQISTTFLRRSCRSNSNISVNNSSSNKKKRTGGNKKNSRKSKTNKNKSKNHAEVYSNYDDDDDDDRAELIEEFFIAACDDSGTVRITSSITSCTLAQESIEEKPDEEQQDGTTNHQTETIILSHDPEGIAVVSSCTFRPSTTSAQLISGGMDCKVHLWDVVSSSSSYSQQQHQQQQQRIRKPLCSVSVQQQQQQQGSSAQAVNPPMVHSLSWSPSGQYFAAGLGNGNVNLYTVPFPAKTPAAGNRRNNEIVQIGQLPGGHSSSVVSVLYPEFGQSTDTDQWSNLSDRVLCSAGSDGKILFWDLSTCLRGDRADDLDAILAELNVSSNVGSNDDKKNGGEDEISKLFDDSLLIDGRSKIADATSPSVLFQIDHQEKINWVTKATITSPSTTPGKIINDTIFVADTSNDITSYKIPLA